LESNKNIVYIGLGLLAVVVTVFWMLPGFVLRPMLYSLLALGSLFLILLVLIQRGRGGGLAGAFGGMGGYSAFGTRAGDVFTRITIVAASLWILGAMALTRLNSSGSKLYDNPAPPPKSSTNQSGGPSIKGADSAGDADSAKDGLGPLGDTPSSGKPDGSDDDSRDR
jgi:preprotein translocase subunit SecG